MEGIRPPGPFLATAATASIPWSAWYADFELYATAIGWSQWDPARQQALLLHCLGQEGRRRCRVAAEAATGAQHRVMAGPPGDSRGQRDQRTGSQRDGDCSAGEA